MAGQPSDRSKADSRKKSASNASDNPSVAEDVFRYVVDSITDGIVIADASGRLVYFNPAAKKISGKGISDTRPEMWSQVYGLYLPDQVTLVPPEQLPLLRALKGEAVKDVEIFLKNECVREGVWLTGSAWPFYDSEGRLLGGVAVFHDMTDKRRTEEEIEGLTRELGARIFDLGAVGTTGRSGQDEKMSRVLVVEDNPVMRTLTIYQLQKLGLVGLGVQNGREAVEVFTGGSFSLIMMDCQMPELDGYEAAREIRRREAEGKTRTPIVAMTAHSYPGARDMCLAAGMDDFIAKPASLEHLRSVLARWLPGVPLRPV